MKYVYKVVTGRKIEPIKYVTRDLGFSQTLDFPLKTVIPLFSSFRRIKKILLSSDYIYAKNEFQELLLLYLILGPREYSKRVIIGIHTAIFIPNNVKSLWKTIHDIQYDSFLYKKFLLSSYSIHVNNSGYSQLLNHEYKVPSEKIVQIPNPIDWESQCIESKNGKVIIVWVGRFTEQKGLDRLERIIEKLSKKEWFSNLEIKIAGEGELITLVQDLADKFKNVQYMGFVQNIKEVYQNADLSVFTAYFDTFAHAVLEPLSYGIPVISFDIDGPKDMITNKKIGRLVLSEDEFIKEISFFYNEKQNNLKSYNSMKRNIFDTINNQYKKSKIFKELDMLFH